MNLDEAWRLLDFIANKSQASGIVGFMRFNLLAKQAQQDQWNRGVEDFEATQQVTDTMNPFLKTTTIVTDITGIVDLPADYAHHIVSEAYYVPRTGGGQWRSTDDLKTAQAANAVTSEVRPPTNYFVKGPEFLPDNQVQYYPAGVRNIRIKYFVLPTDPIWGFTLQNGREVYNPATSVQWQFPAYKHDEIVARMCGKLGINIREPEVSQYAQDMQTEAAANV